MRSLTLFERMLAPMPLRPRAVLCLAAAALAGCDEDALRPPAPASTADAAASAAPASASEPATAAGNAFFHLVARSPDAFELYPLHGAVLTDAAGFLAVLGDGPLRQSPALMKGLEKGAHGRIWGAWPAGAWLVGTDTAHRWSGDRWIEEKLLHEHETLLSMTAWGEDRVLALIARPGNDMRFVQAGGRTAAALPAPSPADPQKGAASGEGDENEGPCKVRMKPRSVSTAGLPGGQLYAAGFTCEPLGHGAAIVERWEPGQTHGTVEALPVAESGSHPSPRGVWARSASEVYVYGSQGIPAAPYLARFDGKAWSLEAAPFTGGIETLSAADDGTLWAVASGAVWKRSGAEWQKAELPAGLSAHAAWPEGADVWISARQTEGKHRAVLLRAARGPAPEPVRLPPRNAMAGALAAGKGFFATAACDHVWVEIAVLGPSKDPATGKPAAVPKKLPALEPVLTGELADLAPVVEDDGSQLHLGIPTPSRDLGRRLVAAYQEKNPGTAPNLSCHEPAGKPENKPAAPAPRRGGAPR